jgi:hypothetical protein
VYSGSKADKLRLGLGLHRLPVYHLVLTWSVLIYGEYHRRAAWPVHYSDWMHASASNVQGPPADASVLSPVAPFVSKVGELGQATTHNRVGGELCPHAGVLIVRGKVINEALKKKKIGPSACRSRPNLFVPGSSGGSSVAYPRLRTTWLAVASPKSGNLDLRDETRI